MKQVQAVTAVIVRPDKQILIYLRDGGNGAAIRYPNMWSFFGGTVEGEETLVACLLREMKEELELELNPRMCEEVFKYFHDSGEDHVFICHITGMEELVLHEGKEKRWMTLEEVKTVDLAWRQEIIIPVIEPLL